MESQASDGLADELRQVSGVLRHALAEACGTEIRQANTGELQRVGEVLLTATEAAKQMVAIRRRAGRERKTAAAPVPTPAMSEAALATHRVFVDVAGVAWDAFAVYPSADTTGRARLPGPYQNGWLSFDSGAERRRLSPIPDDWQTVSDEALARMCERAEPASKRAGRPSRPDNPRAD